MKRDEIIEILEELVDSYGDSIEPKGTHLRIQEAADHIIRLQVRDAVRAVKELNK